MSSAPGADGGSRLCLACGLCCQGMLHDWVRIPASERAAAEGLGLRVDEIEAGMVFELPCPRHSGGECTVYRERPSPCRDYRCRLLRQYMAGSMSFEEGLDQVRRLRDLARSLALRLGRSDTDPVSWRTWRRIARPQDGSSQAWKEWSPEALLDLTEWLVCVGRFRNRGRSQASTVQGR